MNSRIRLWSEGDLCHLDCLVEAIVPETTVGGALASGLCCVHLVAAGPGGCAVYSDDGVFTNTSSSLYGPESVRKVLEEPPVIHDFLSLYTR